MPDASMGLPKVNSRCTAVVSKVNHARTSVPERIHHFLLSGVVIPLEVHCFFIFYYQLLRYIQRPGFIQRLGLMERSGCIRKMHISVN